MDTVLRQAYERLRADAMLLAGELTDIPKRVAGLHAIYRHSKGNHAFPQVALHGALWAYGFFETTGTLGNAISYRYWYSRNERVFRLQMLKTFSDGFKSANRSVFIDTWTNYYFSLRYGTEREANQIIAQELLDGLNAVHEAARRGFALGKAEKKKMFELSLRWEQEQTVAPTVKEEVAKFSCPILTALVLKPAVRFRYFPRWKYFFFKNFADTSERIQRAMDSYDLAERIGWDVVVNTMAAYKRPPPIPLSDYKIGDGSDL
ncbi:MAG: hypothetical protein COV75_03550 [Candidatus Omnitrophica bacterium CG11_big_fil_rev_8_21_14_0_20_63_9]|nr:MAG: hypothetical protein COV75_03550 [Candidatus Omnitrophica bacterium CG11_big_fil_rev_8_21_14_0_20_63_9]